MKTFFCEVLKTPPALINCPNRARIKQIASFMWLIISNITLGIIFKPFFTKLQLYS